MQMVQTCMIRYTASQAEIHPPVLFQQASEVHWIMQATGTQPNAPTMLTDFSPQWLHPDLLRLRTKQDGLATMVNLPTQGYILLSEDRRSMVLIDCIYEVGCTLQALQSYLPIKTRSVA